MKKIISILLMLSMVFSLVACSSEPTSDVVDNDNSVVNGEVSEEVSDNEDEVSHASNDEMSEGEFEAFNYLVSADWQSGSYTEDYEKWIENDDISINFNDDFTFTYTDSKGDFEGEWVIDGYDEEHDELWYILIIRDEEFIATHNMNGPTFTFLRSSERDYQLEFKADHSELYSELLAGLVYSEQDLPLDGSPIDVYEFFEDGKMMRQINGVWEEGTWSASRLSQNNIYITMTFGDELLNTEYLTDRKNEMYINDIFVLQPYNLSDVIWMLEEITYADGTTELFVFDNNFGITQSVEAEKLYNTAIHFKTGTDGNFIDKIRDRSAINDASRWRAGTIYTESELETIKNSFVSDVDFSEIPIYDFQILLGTEEFDFNITSDFFSQFNSDGRNTATAQIINGDGMNSDTPYGAYILITTDSTEFLFGFDGYKRPNDAMDYSGADG